MKRALTFGLMAFAIPASADPLTVQNMRYLCDRDVEVPATFVTGPEDAVVILQIDGRQILLYQEVAASGVRYAWPSGGASYVLSSQGDRATIAWREDGQETPILDCSAQM